MDSESTSRLREEIARTLRDAIARQGLTQAAAAEKLGISRDSLHRIVAGKTMPTAELLARCAKQWGLSLSVMGPNFRHPSEDSEKTARQSEVYPLAGAKPNQLGVFLCHASEDKPMVRKLYERLYEDAFLPWLDSEDLLPGQDWDYEIRNAVRASDAVLVCLSGHLLKRVGTYKKRLPMHWMRQKKSPKPQFSSFLCCLNRVRSRPAFANGNGSIWVPRKDTKNFS